MKTYEFSTEGYAKRYTGLISETTDFPLPKPEDPIEGLVTLKKHGYSVLQIDRVTLYDIRGYWSVLKFLEFDPKTRKVGSPFQVLIWGLEPIAIDTLMKKVFLAIYQIEDLTNPDEEVPS